MNTLTENTENLTDPSSVSDLDPIHSIPRVDKSMIRLFFDQNSLKSKNMNTLAENTQTI